MYLLWFTWWKGYLMRIEKFLFYLFIWGLHFIGHKESTPIILYPVLVRILESSRTQYRSFIVLIWLFIYLDVDEFIITSYALGLEEQWPNNTVQGSSSIFNDPRSTSLCTRPKLSKRGIIPGSNYKGDSLLHACDQNCLHGKWRAWEGPHLYDLWRSACEGAPIVKHPWPKLCNEF